MMLVPTLQRMADTYFYASFWSSHRDIQKELDRQNEGELSYEDYVINQMTARILGSAK